ncbi:MAG: polyprenyl synthetase family protein, partial [Clostridia bacterium]|nr:polyprenyl synthetase family protein [Clostridia bacterium]
YKKASPELIEAMKYSALNGGKRLRSILCTEICYMLGGKREDAMPFACAIELIHAYSLVHDDLPAMDNADTRRGQPSCHKKYGEALGILCGDALLNSAFEIMLDNCAGLSQINAAKVIAESSGSEGMISGQVKDLKVGSASDVTGDMLIDIIEQKTMAIISSASVAGAYIANADEETVLKIKNFAYYLGLAFQIRDDFEDIKEDTADFNDSPNFINALGEDDAAKLLNEHSTACKNIISEFKNNDFIMGLLDFLF